MSQFLTITGGTYAKHPITQSEDGDFVWGIEMFDSEDDSDPSNLTDREYTFEVFGVDGTSLGSYEIGTGITVASNVVTISIDKDDWVDWRKNCALKYELRSVLADGTNYPLFSDTFTLVS